MQRVSRDHTFTEFAAERAPVCEVAPGEWLLVETWDCFGGEMAPGKQREEITPGLANPTTGPIALRGAKAGDMIRITIGSIEVAERGFVSAEGQTRFIEVRDGFAVFSETARLPLRPMIGVIGVAPAHAPIKTTVPGVHGGNMDTVDVRPGAQVFLRARVDGARVGVGDVHACQGDGEVAGQGLEVSAEVLLRIDLEPEPLPARNPYVLVDGRVSLIASAASFKECIDEAVDDMVGVVADRMKLSAAEARMLISLVGEVRISQIVNPLLTARVVMPVMW